MARKSARKNMRSAAKDARGSVQAAESALDKIGTATGQAISSVAANVGPALEDARDRIAPAVEDARDRARDTIVPAVTVAVASGRKKGREVAERTGLVEEKKKSHKLRNLVLLLGLGGVVAFVAKRFTGQDADPAWTASRDSASRVPPRPATAPSPDAAVPAAPIGGAAAPVDESETAPTAPFASEETVESPTPTTPDEPLEKKQV